MGKTLSKVDKPNANVVNEVVVNTGLNLVEICLIIITVITLLILALKLYAMHNKKLKKKYMSRSNELDKI